MRSSIEFEFEFEITIEINGHGAKSNALDIVCMLQREQGRPVVPLWLCCVAMAGVPA